VNIPLDDMIVEEIVRLSPNKQLAEYHLDTLIDSIKGKLFNRYSNFYGRRVDLYEHRV
jgi:hypothetical protein